MSSPSPTTTAPGASPLVSIITPAFNVERFLPDTIASVIAQSLADWEWIIADNASTDGTAALVEDAMRSDPRIRLVRVPGSSGRAAGARNAALAEARGRYLAFLDADDLWTPDKLEKQVEWLEDHSEFDAVCTWYELFGDAERLRSEIRVMRPGGPIGRSELRQVGAVLTSTFLMRRELYDEIGGMDEDARLKAGEDVEYFCRIIAGYRIYRIPETLTRYRLVGGGSSLGQSQWTPENRTGWSVLEVLREKNVLTPDEVRARRGFLYYEQARNSFFWADGPFRGALWRSIATGRPPARAVLMFALCFLPGPILRPVLISLQRFLGSARTALR